MAPLPRPSALGPVSLAALRRTPWRAQPSAPPSEQTLAAGVPCVRAVGVGGSPRTSPLPGHGDSAVTQLGQEWRGAPSPPNLAPIALLSAVAPLVAVSPSLPRPGQRIFVALRVLSYARGWSRRGPQSASERERSMESGVVQSPAHLDPSRSLSLSRDPSRFVASLFHRVEGP